MHAQIQIFLLERGEVQAQRRENSLDFFSCLFLGFFSPKFSGDARGPTIYGGGGGVQMLISIEFDRTCDLPGMGVRTPPPSGSAHT